MKRLILLGLLCFVANPSIAEEKPRWYTQDQLNQGEVLFKQNCAICHGDNAEATPDWKITDASGNYPPPPLNGTAHAWHHDLDLLRRTVQEGGQKLGGVMPPFKGKLSDMEIDQVIAYFQSKWPDDLYQKWAGRFKKTDLPSLDDIIEANSNRLTKRLKQRFGNAEIGEPEKTDAEGIWQVKFENRYLYLLNGGKFVLIGDLIDLESGQNLTEKARQGQVVDAIAKYQEKDLIVFSPEGDVKATINIFTDTSCPYCQKLHQEVPKLLESGIKVRYLPYARGGRTGPGYQTLKSVWCAEDRNQAMTDAKNQIIDDLPEGDCDLARIVDEAYLTGIKIGITGTPALFKESGEKIQGYVPYQQLIPMVLN